MGTGLASLQVIKEQNLAQNAQERGDFLQAEFKKLLKNSHVSVTYVVVV
jgi:diaminobutyrate-2-oxoglutarate transaminase